MAKAAQFSLRRARMASVEVSGSPVTSQVLTAPLPVRRATWGQLKKRARNSQESVILSGKRVLCLARTAMATVTCVAAPASKHQPGPRLIALPRSQFYETWWEEHVAGLI